jgi:hypothetical protein
MDVLGPLLVPGWLHAAPSDYVITPIVEQGEKEIEFKWGPEKRKDLSSGIATSLRFGLGVNSWWATELSGAQIWPGHIWKNQDRLQGRRQIQRCNTFRHQRRISTDYVSSADRIRVLKK